MSILRSFKRNKLDAYNKRKALVTRPDISTVGVGGILGGIFADIYQDILISSSKNNPIQLWAYYMDKYVKNPANEVEQDKKSLSSARGNINKELHKQSMTWRVFCKGLRFFQIFNFKITIEFKRKDTGESYIYSRDIDLVSDYNVKEEDDEDDE